MRSDPAAALITEPHALIFRINGCFVVQSSRAHVAWDRWALQQASHGLFSAI